MDTNSNTTPVNCTSKVNQLTWPARVRSRPNRIQQRDQAAALQRFAYDAACALRSACTNPDTGTLTMTPAAAKAIKELVGAWDTARDAVRVLRGKGLPASVKSRAARASAQIEPINQP